MKAAMTREQKLAKARELREAGATYKEIGSRLGVSTTTALRWLDPDAAEADRARARAYKARNREAIHAYDREYNETHKGECPQCGGETERKTARRGGRCQKCISGDVDRRRRQVEKWWAEGLQMPEIAERLGWSMGHLRREIHKMRAAGYSLPYRYRPGRRNATKFPEQVPS